MSLAARSWQGHGQSGRGVAGDRHVRGGVPWYRRRRVLLWMLPTLLVAASGAVLATLAASYQPLGPGGTGGGSFPHLPTGTGIRWVSAYPPQQQLYVPPQRGTFALAGSIRNNGSFPVTIEAVSQPAASPLTAAGRVLYMAPSDRDFLQFRVHVLRNLTLGPGQMIEIGMPLRTLYCADRRAYTDVVFFLVKERFGVFTHTVAIPFIDGSAIVLNAPGGATGYTCP